MKKLITLAALALALVGLTAGPAQAANDRETVTMTWYLPKGVDPNVDPFASWFPQTAAPVPGVWCQHDVYRYDTKKHRALVDALDDDGLLTFDAHTGRTEDAAVYLSATFSRCNPEPTPSPSPSESTPEPSPSPSETTPEPSPSPSETTPEPSPSPSESTPTPPETSSSTTSPSPRRPVKVQTDAPDQLAATGVDPVVPLMLGVAFVAAGAALLFARRTRRN